jgi:SAM-dependent methyltransferase
MYKWLTSHYSNVIGSEYLGNDLESGQVKNGIRHESLLSLSFPDSAVDSILSFDVLEHIPNYERAIKECARVIRPGGGMLISVPFICNAQLNVVRARIVNGRVVHLMEPEYHGNPLDPDGGALCFYHFGWEFIRTFQLSGFSNAVALLYWSSEFAYLGGTQVLMWATR